MLVGTFSVAVSELQGALLLEPKAFSPIIDTDAGSLMVDRLVHSWKAPWLISITLVGRFTVDRLAHSLKALSSTFTTFECIVTAVIVQPLNAPLGTTV